MVGGGAGRSAARSHRGAAEPASALSRSAAASAVPAEAVDGAQEHHTMAERPDTDLLLQHRVVEREEHVAIHQVVKELLAVLPQSNGLNPGADITNCIKNES